MRISILGLGWLGLPLARFLQDQVHQVIGSTTSPDKRTIIQESGIETILLELKPHPVGIGFQRLFDSDVLIISIPPKSKHQSGEFYLEQLKFLKEMISNGSVRKVIFISSTGIYPKETRSEPYDEQETLDQTNASNLTLLRAEEMFQSQHSFSTTIIRFGGLMGADRIPIKYFSDKENVDGESRVNYIHQQDAVRMIDWILTNNLWNGVFNGVAPIHSKKRDVLEICAKNFGFQPPKSYLPSSDKSQRLIDSKAILETGFSFNYPDPTKFTYEVNSDQ